MEKALIILLLLLMLSYAILAIIKPAATWKREFISKKVRKPSDADLLLMRVSGVFLIFVCIGLAYVFLIK
ncbi:hypothetical protein QJ48_00810 [Paenibacillus sp. A3]|uniref:DUF6199 family natural product biosynthesis protein n=1 Tax=Paenibacillus sp. A3 TaxID=1337054 RepID=UPI0006D563DE|nr:DUF6199 family natural product biosynthesis protein [Paenibacillus sp. A3]KPV61341.1 hypothetical protein QJ48_00810 [Paenibacillus sp. A3]